MVAMRAEWVGVFLLCFGYSFTIIGADHYSADLGKQYCETCVQVKCTYAPSTCVHGFTIDPCGCCFVCLENLQGLKTKLDLKNNIEDITQAAHGFVRPSDIYIYFDKADDMGKLSRNRRLSEAGKRDQISGMGIPNTEIYGPMYAAESVPYWLRQLRDISKIKEIHEDLEHFRGKREGDVNDEETCPEELPSFRNGIYVFL